MLVSPHSGVLAARHACGSISPSILYVRVRSVVALALTVGVPSGQLTPFTVHLGALMQVCQAAHLLCQRHTKQEELSWFIFGTQRRTRPYGL